MYIIACHVHLNAKFLNFMFRYIHDVLSIMRSLQILSIPIFNHDINDTTIFYSLTLTLQLMMRIDWDQTFTTDDLHLCLFHSLVSIFHQHLPRISLAQQIRYSRTSASYGDFLYRGLLLESKLLPLFITVRLKFLLRNLTVVIMNWWIDSQWLSHRWHRIYLHRHPFPSVHFCFLFFVYGYDLFVYLLYNDHWHCVFSVWDGCISMNCL